VISKLFPKLGSAGIVIIYLVLKNAIRNKINLSKYAPDK
jgi:hypothetical protein